MPSTPISPATRPTTRSSRGRASPSCWRSSLGQVHQVELPEEREPVVVVAIAHDLPALHVCHGATAPLEALAVGRAPAERMLEGARRVPFDDDDGARRREALDARLPIGEGRDELAQTR